MTHLEQSRFQGQRALVTGAGAGIGRAIALALAERGAHVCVLDADRAAAEETAAMARRLGAQAATIVHDMGCASVVASIASMQDGFGAFDLLVNNAGISPKKPDGRKRMIWEIPPDEWQRVIQVNLCGYFFSLRAVLPGMVERRAGAIVNIASLAGLRYSSIAGAAYATAKNAVVGLTRQAAGEVAEFGVRINCVAPGRIETAMASVAGGEFNEAIRASTPLRRLGQPADIADAVMFLLSEQAGFITGETLPVTGGRGL